MTEGVIPGPGRGILPVDSAQEQFQRAYVLSIVAAARCTYSEPSPDFDGIDLTVRQEIGSELHHSVVDLQMKSTRRQEALSADALKIRLDRRSYDRLRSTRTSWPRLLIGILVPPEIENWMEQDEERLSLLRCAYWLSLQGRPEIEQASITVQIPRANVFSVDSLCELLYSARAEKDDLGA